jgi:hypothetical protein
MRVIIIPRLEGRLLINVQPQNPIWIGGDLHHVRSIVECVHNLSGDLVRGRLHRPRNHVVSRGGRLKLSIAFAEVGILAGSEFIMIHCKY